jgi:hypothetical protein
MKLGRTLIILWAASMILFVSTAIVTLFTPELMNGVPGLTIRFFLGYCAIIVVAQVLLAMDAIRKLLEDLAAKKPVSFRLLLR